MNELKFLTKLVFVFISVATVAACTTAPASFSNIIAAPKIQEAPPAPAPEPLTTKTQGDISHDDGIVVAIPANLATAPKRATKKRSKKKAAPQATDSSATAAKEAKSSDVGQGFRALESADDCCGTGCATPCLAETSGGGSVENISQSGDKHRALGGADDCCGTGCSKACVVE